MRRRRSRTAAPVLAAGGLLLAACSDSAVPGGLAGERSTPTAAEESRTIESSFPELSPQLKLDVPDPDSIYDPVRGGELLPDGFRQLLRRDAILPVYDPEFTTAAGVSWPEESLVIGVDLEGEARAYPVGFLNRREIVNDNHRGIPTLVTW